MGLLDRFNQFIVEHGSAVIQEKHLGLFRDQLRLADKKIAELESVVLNLKDKLEDSQTTINQLKKENTKLNEKIQKYENPTHDIPLDVIKLNILKLLFSAEKLTTEQIGTSQKLQLQTAKYHLEELANLRMVSLNRYSAQVPGLGPFHPNSLRQYSAWKIMQPGRKFLITNGHVS